MNIKLIFIAIIICIPFVESNRTEELGQTIISVIDKYDSSGKGAIPIDRYGQFLSQIFMKASKIEPSQFPFYQLLLKATNHFTSTKEGKQVGVQQFYMDLLKHFSEFLQANHEYQQLINSLYVARPPQKPDVQQL